MLDMKTQTPAEARQSLDDGDMTATQKGFVIKAIENRPLSLFRLPTNDTDDELLVSGPIQVIGQARNRDSGDWHNVVIYIDRDNKRRQWLMPMGLLAGEKTEAIRYLFGAGLFIASNNKAKTALFDYLHYGESKKYTTIYQCGWYDNHYVLSDGHVITGGGDNNLLLINPDTAKRSVGTLELWQRNVSAKCAGNSRLVFTVSAALAGPLLAFAGIEGGGVHLRGKSSTGKSTALRAGQSVHGNGEKLKTWCTTKNGLEGVAAQHNHSALVIDEIGESDANSVGPSIYQLGNGTGKTRANRDGSSKEPVKFLLIFITSGEKTLSEQMRTGKGGGAMAGQEIRLLNIESDAGAGMGVFECIHDSDTAQQFADEVGEQAMKNSGHAGPEFINYLINNREECITTISEVRESFRAGCKDADPQVQRAATRFALIAAAGDIATKAGITQWPDGESISAALTCFKVWRENWTPNGSRENEKAIEQVRAFIQEHASRFEDGDNTGTVHNRAGFMGDGGREYWTYPTTFNNEVCNGLNSTTVIRALRSGGFLNIDKDEKPQARRTPDGVKRQRFYVINDSILGDGVQDDE